MSDGWNALLGGRTQRALERDVLPQFLHDRRWFGDKSRRPPTARMHATIPLEGSGNPILLGLVNVTTPNREQSRYVLPMTIKWTRFDRMGAAVGNVVSAVRRGPHEGTLLDASGDQSFNTLLLASIHGSKTVTQGNHRLEFRPTTAFEQMPSPEIEKLTVLDREQSNSTSIANSKYVIKLLRRVTEGVHPEIEIGQFLVEAGFKNAPDLLGWAQLIEGESTSALAVVHRFIENQGDAWTVTGAYLDRFIDEQRILSTEFA